jgi:ribonuclease HI
LEDKHNEHIKIYTDGSKKDEIVGCAVITPDQKFRTRLKPQTTVYSAEQEAIIKAIYVTQRTGERRVIIMGSLSTLMVVEGDINSKNSKTLSLRKLLDEDREKVTLLWALGHQKMKPQTKKQKLPWKTTS